MGTLITVVSWMYAISTLSLAVFQGSLLLAVPKEFRQYMNITVKTVALITLSLVFSPVTWAITIHRAVKARNAWRKFQRAVENNEIDWDAEFAKVTERLDAREAAFNKARA